MRAEFKKGTMQSNAGALRKKGDPWIGYRIDRESKSTKYIVLTFKEIFAAVTAGGLLGIAIPIAQALLY